VLTNSNGRWQDLSAADALVAQDAAQLGSKSSTLAAANIERGSFSPKNRLRANTSYPIHGDHPSRQLAENGAKRPVDSSTGRTELAPVRGRTNHLESSAVRFQHMLSDPKHNLAKLQQIAMMDRTRLLNPYAVNERAVGAAEVSQQHSAIDHR